MENGMTSKLRKGALAIVGGLLAATAAPAAAQLGLHPGLYTIRVDGSVYPNLPAAGQCLIQDNNGFGGPVRYMWAEPNAKSYMCGWGDWDAFYANGQALFRVRAVGQRAYILENKRSGQCLQYEQGTRAVVFSSQNCNAGNLSAIWYIEGSYSYTFSTIRPWNRPGACLIFGNNGYDYSPQVYRWPNAPGDGQWCGLGSQYAVERTGQAIFALDKFAN
jgi:hypothetical protein